jgi:hypothetical protein
MKKFVTKFAIQLNAVLVILGVLVLQCGLHGGP